MHFVETTVDGRELLGIGPTLEAARRDLARRVTRRTGRKLTRLNPDGTALFGPAPERFAEGLPPAGGPYDRVCFCRDEGGQLVCQCRHASPAETFSERGGSMRGTLSSQGGRGAGGPGLHSGRSRAFDDGADDGDLDQQIIDALSSLDDEAKSHVLNFCRQLAGGGDEEFGEEDGGLLRGRLPDDRTSMGEDDMDPEDQKVIDRHCEKFSEEWRATGQTKADVLKAYRQAAPSQRRDMVDGLRRRLARR
jgi:hypothetical protein